MGRGNTNERTKQRTGRASESLCHLSRLSSLPLSLSLSPPRADEVGGGRRDDADDDDDDDDDDVGSDTAAAAADAAAADSADLIVELRTTRSLSTAEAKERGGGSSSE